MSDYSDSESSINLSCDHDEAFIAEYMAFLEEDLAGVEANVVFEYSPEELEDERQFRDYYLDTHGRLPWY